jgi:hypothetical protein
MGSIVRDQRPFGGRWWLGEWPRFAGQVIRWTNEEETSMGSDRDQGVAATRMTVRLPGLQGWSDQDVRWWRRWRRG